MCKRKIFFAISIAFVLVLVFSVPVVYSDSDFAESESLKFLEQVANINMDSYSLVSIDASRARMPDSQHFQTDVKVVISNGQREFEALITLVDGKLRSYRLDLLSGDLEEEEAGLDNCLTAANRAIDGYRMHFSAGHCEGFAQKASAALQTRSSTVEDESAILDIRYDDDSTTPSEYVSLQWSEKINGRFAMPHRSVTLSVSKSGMLTRFIDNLGIYQVATTNVNVSEEEAIDIAMPHIEAYARKNGPEVESIEAALEFTSDITSSRGDRFLIYPKWNIFATFDEINEENVLGYAVMIWADNGKAYHHGPQGVLPPTGVSKPVYSSWLFVVIIIVISALSGAIALTKRRSKARQTKNRTNIDFKIVFTSIMIALLCCLSMPQMASAKTSTALGSRHDVPQEEQNLDSAIASLITSYSSIADYTAYNWYGASTTAANIYDAAFGVGHTYSISWYIGHGYWDTWWHFWGWPWQWHTHTQYWISADDGSHVYDCDIYTHSGCQNVKFVYLWSCEQGNEIGSMITYPCGEVRARGMPLAWLHTSSLSSDGYSSPDGNGRLCNAFEGVAPFLSYDGLDGETNAGYYFLMYFYYASLYRGYYYSINQALDYAANAVWGTTFGNCILRTGYTIGWYTGKMKVYGDGGIHISDHKGGGGGCPLLYVSDGSEYVYEGLLDIHDPQGNDIIREHTLTAKPERINNVFSLRLVEHPLTHSYIDQVKLFALLEDGKTVELPLISAVHSEYGNELRKLLFSDDVKTDTPANQAIELKFLAPRILEKLNAIGLVFQIEGNNAVIKR